jgi:hypothetical protein
MPDDHRFALLPALSLLLVLGTALAADDRGQFGRVVRIDRSAFLPDAGSITFDEHPVGTLNPIYPPDAYGAGSTRVTVTFGGYFQGQAIGEPGQCPAGAAPTGCIQGEPSGPLGLDPTAPATFIETDRANPHSPSLSGTPRFNAPVSMLFDTDVAGVGLMGGFFNAQNSTAIRAFDRRGRLIGGVTNLELGMEYLALVTEDGSERIAGLQFSLVGPEPAGFGIDDLSFAKRAQLDNRQLRRLSEALGVAAPAPAAPDKAERPTPQPPKPLSSLFGKGAAGPAEGPGTPPKSLKEVFEARPK